MSYSSIDDPLTKRYRKLLNNQLGCPMRFLLQKREETNYNLRRPHQVRSSLLIDRFKNCFSSNKLIFKYALPASLMQIESSILYKYVIQVYMMHVKLLKKILVVSFVEGNNILHRRHHHPCQFSISCAVLCRSNTHDNSVNESYLFVSAWADLP